MMRVKTLVDTLSIWLTRAVAEEVVPVRGANSVTEYRISEAVAFCHNNPSNYIKNTCMKGKKIMYIQLIKTDHFL